VILTGRRLTVVLVVSGVLALAGAGFCAYVAYGAAGVQSEMSRSDAAFVVTPTRSGLWQVDGLVAGMLRLRGDLGYRKSAHLYELARAKRRDRYGLPSRNLNALAELALAKAALEPLSDRLRSRVENLQGLYSVEEALNGDPQTRGIGIQRAIDHFRRGANADQTNQEVLFNLELVLRTLTLSQRIRRSGLDPNAPRGTQAGTSRLHGGYGY
jgi:hypothetical protein